MIKGNCKSLDALINRGFTYRMLSMALQCHIDTIQKYAKTGKASDKLKQKSDIALQKVTERGIKCPNEVKRDYETGLEPVFRALLN